MYVRESRILRRLLLPPHPLTALQGVVRAPRVTPYKFSISSRNTTFVGWATIGGRWLLPEQLKPRDARIFGA